MQDVIFVVTVVIHLLIWKSKIYLQLLHHQLYQWIVYIHADQGQFYLLYT